MFCIIGPAISSKKWAHVRLMGSCRPRIEAYRHLLLVKAHYIQIKASIWIFCLARINCWDQRTLRKVCYLTCKVRSLGTMLLHTVNKYSAHCWASWVCSWPRCMTYSGTVQCLGICPKSISKPDMCAYNGKKKQNYQYIMITNMQSEEVRTYIQSSIQPWHFKRGQVDILLIDQYVMLSTICLCNHVQKQNW